MPTIEFRKNYPPIPVPNRVNLMEALRKAGMPVASSCQGDGVCGKCVITVLNGLDGLSSPTPLEEKLKIEQGLNHHQRISCQTQVDGDIVIDTTYW